MDGTETSALQHKQNIKTHTPSHTRTITRKDYLCTCFSRRSTARSTSASVVKRPSPNRSEECAISSSVPVERKRKDRGEG